MKETYYMVIIDDQDKSRPDFEIRKKSFFGLSWDPVERFPKTKELYVLENQLKQLEKNKLNLIDFPEYDYYFKTK